MPELCLIYWWYCSITLTLQTHKQVRKYRIFNCTDLYSNAQYYILKLPLYIPVDTMYIKFYNALGQVDPLAGRGQSPVPKLGRGQGRHLTLPLYSHMLSLTHTHTNMQSLTLIRTNAHLQLFGAHGHFSTWSW